MIFKEFKKYLAKFDRLSICHKETLKYENYANISEVDEKYDNLYVYGVGMIDSEFYKTSEGRYVADYTQGKLELVSCIEIVLDDKPRFN